MSGGEPPMVETFGEDEHVLSDDASRLVAEDIGAPLVARSDGRGGRDLQAVARPNGRDHARLCVEDSVEQVSWFDVGSVEVARILDPRIDRVASLGGEPFEDRRDRPRARWRLGAGSDLGCAHLHERPINRGTRHRIFRIDERLDVCDPQLREDADCALLLAERK